PEAAHPPDPRPPPPPRPPPHPRHAHPEGPPTPRDRPADAAQAEHPQPELAELAYRDLEAGELRPRPPARRLELAHAVEPAREVGDGGERPVGDGLGVDGGRVREHDSRPGEM